MKTSASMDEIRKIRDANSLRHLSQTSEEFTKEMQESLDWLREVLGKPVKIVSEKIPNAEKSIA
jgi:hypothetical protein